MNDDLATEFDPVAYHKRNEERITKQGGVRSVYWTEPNLRITRLRLTSDPGCPIWDLSYCHGEIGDEFVFVQLPFHQLPKGNLRGAILKAAKEDGLYAKATGIFDVISRFQ